MQYSLRSLFLATAGVAVLFGVACALPDPLSLSVMFFITLILPGATIALAYYGCGYPKAFAVGCLLSPASTAFFAIPILVFVAWTEHKNLWEYAQEIDHETVAMKLEIVVFHAMNISCGLLAVAVRWWVQSSRMRENDAQMKLLALSGKQSARPSEEIYKVIQARIRPLEQELNPSESEVAVMDR